MAEHASIGYTSLAWINYFDCRNSGWLFVDPLAQSDGLILIKSLRLTFAIPLLFFISGIFVKNGIAQYGFSGWFLKRLRRLGIPLLFIAFVLVPLMEYLPCHLSWTDPGLLVFLKAYFSEWKSWPILHGWFLWVLLIFDGAAVMFYLCNRYPIISTPLNSGQLLLIFIAINWAAFLAGPALITSSMDLFWRILSGPFDLVPPTLFVCLFFYCLGVGYGSMAKEGLPELVGFRIPQRPLPWILLGIAGFWLQCQWPLEEEASFMTLYFQPEYHLNPITTPILCLILSVAAVSAFQRWFNRPPFHGCPITSASYTIYVFHFPLCIWTSWLLLPFQGEAPTKLALSVIVGIALPVLLYVAGQMLTTAVKNNPAIKIQLK
ncbi:MAG: acyltransferase family protein [Gammaproteobacteria bacterium]|nr:acyltransferase family protein [Gammaproteobacteria bacterium]